LSSSFHFLGEEILLVR